MASAVPTTGETKTAFVIGQRSFTCERLIEALRAGDYRVERDVVLAGSGALGLIELPGGPEVALLYSAGVRLVGVMTQNRTGPVPSPAWPFEATVHEKMSMETILQVCNDVYYRHQGMRRHRRLPVALEIVVFGTDRALRTTTVNFSRGGTFVRSLNPFPPRTAVQLRLANDLAQGQLGGRVLYNIGLRGDRLERLDQPGRPVVAHPGMAVQFEPGQDEVLEGWMKVAEIFSGGEIARGE